MTKKEIETRIKQEENRVKRLKAKLADIKFEIDTTQMAVEFWKVQLKNAKE